MAALSLIVLCKADLSSRDAGTAEGVVRTLAAFLAASVRGLVREAVLAGPPGHDLGFIADHAGCAFVEAEAETEALRKALALGRAADLVVLYAGYVPEIGFVDALEDLLRSRRSEEHGWLIRAAPESGIARLLPSVAPAVGLLASRRLCTDVAIPSFANLIKATRARSATRLRLRRIV